MLFGLARYQKSRETDIVGQMTERRPHSANAELPHLQFRISISSRYEKRHRDVSASQTNGIFFETLDANIGVKTKYDSGVNLMDSSYLIPSSTDHPGLH
jgi:hypothetical protein